MKVLLATGRVAPESCGVGDYSVALAKSLAAAGDTITLLSATERADDAGISMVSLRDWSYRALPGLWRILRELRPDVVHVQYPSQGYRGGLASKLLPLLARLAGSTVVETWHEQWYLRQGPDLFLKSTPTQGVVFVRWNYLENLAQTLRWALWGKVVAYIPNASTIPQSVLSSRERLELRGSIKGTQTRLIVFFGVMSAAKRPELVMEIADPATDYLLFAGEFSDSVVESRVRSRAQHPEWLGKVRFTGRVGDAEAANVLAAADAIVLPFREGAGPWNSSLSASLAQGSFVVTTCADSPRFEPEQNVFYSGLDDTDAMRRALTLHAGRKIDRDPAADAWVPIAAGHRSLYASLLAGDRSDPRPTAP